MASRVSLMERKLEDNKHKYAAKSDADTKVVREGNEVHVYMTMIRSHFSPDNIEGIKVGDKVYFAKYKKFSIPVFQASLLSFISFCF